MTFDAKDIVWLVFWIFLGAFAVAIFLVTLFSKSSRVRIGWVLAVLLFFSTLLGWGYYKIFFRPAHLAASDAKNMQERKLRYEAAKSLFEKRCESSGGRIYKTVDDVIGIFMLNLRADDRTEREADSKWPDAGLPNEFSGEGYIENFLLWEQRRGMRNTRGVLNDHISDLSGFQYVDAKDSSGELWRYTLGEKGEEGYPFLKKTSIDGEHARYAVAFENLGPAEDRERWVAGTQVKVIDTQTSETLAESTWYSFEPGQGSTAGFRQPWRFAISCPLLTGGEERAPTRFFVDQVLKPKQAQ